MSKRLELTDPDVVAVYRFVAGYFGEHNCSPSLTEISEHCYMNRMTANRRIDFLCAKGYLTRLHGVPRSIGLVEGKKL